MKRTQAEINASLRFVSVRREAFAKIRDFARERGISVSKALAIILDGTWDREGDGPGIVQADLDHAQLKVR